MGCHRLRERLLIVAIALVTGTNVGAGSTDRNTVTTAGVNTTGADLLIAVVSDFGTSRAALSDSKGNSWAALTTTQLGTSGACRIFWSKPSSVGSAHTFTATQANSFPTVNVAAFSGVHASPVDQQNGATFSVVTTAQPGSLTPTQAGSLIIAGFTSDNQALTLAINQSFTIGSNIPVSSNCERGALAYLIQGAAAAVNPAWSWTTNSNGALRIASFLPAAVTPTVPKGAAFLTF